MLGTDLHGSDGKAAILFLAATGGNEQQKQHQDGKERVFSWFVPGCSAGFTAKRPGEMNVGGHQGDDQQEQQHASHPDGEVNRGIAAIVDGVGTRVKSDSEQDESRPARAAKADAHGVVGGGFQDGEFRGGLGVEKIKPTGDAASKGENVDEGGGH